MTAARGTGNRIRRFLSAHSLGAGIAARFAAALLIGFAVRSRIGYHAVLSSPPVLIAAAAVVSPLPDFALGIYMAALVLGQAFAAGTEAGCVAAALLVMLFLLFLHGIGTNAAVFALTAATGCFGFLPVIPLLCGIRRKLSALPAIASGVVLCSFLGALPEPGSAAASALPADFAGKIQYLCGRIFAGEFPVILIAEALHHVPGLEALNAFGTDGLGLQLGLLAGGLAGFLLITVLSCKRACARFEAIDL